MKREFLVKLNREFESNLLRQPVSFFSLSVAFCPKSPDGFRRAQTTHVFIWDLLFLGRAACTASSLAANSFSSRASAAEYNASVAFWRIRDTT
jgi:hypothetical protein